MVMPVVVHHGTGGRGWQVREGQSDYFSMRIREDFSEEVAAYGFVGPVRVVFIMKAPLCILPSAA